MVTLPPTYLFNDEDDNYLCYLCYRLRFFLLNL